MSESRQIALEATPLSVSLDLQTTRLLTRYCADHDISKSDAIRNGLTLLFAQTPAQRTAYEIGKHLFGRHASGRTDGSVNSGKYYKEAIRAKHASRYRPPGSAA